MAKFFQYSQNNSFGQFVINDKVDQFVIIEADNAAEADIRAEHIGIYFDGCRDRIDCSCCGDRWYRADGSWSDEGEDFPSVYGEPVLVTPERKKGDQVIVYFLDGTVGYGPESSKGILTDSMKESLRAGAATDPSEITKTRTADDRFANILDDEGNLIEIIRSDRIDKNKITRILRKYPDTIDD